MNAPVTLICIIYACNRVNKSTACVCRSDASLWCVSAWNDNGKSGLIDEEKAADMLYRTDFFPGLGWMITKGEFLG